MANQEHLDLLKQGVEIWNQWRKEHTEIRPDLSRADLSDANRSDANRSDPNLRYANPIGANLYEANLTEANLYHANLFRAYLSGANLTEANLSRASLQGANLSYANLFRVNLIGASLTHAILSFANLSRADLFRANLIGAFLIGTKLIKANLTEAVLVQTNLREADLTRCTIYGIAAWNLDLEGAKQDSLVITPYNEPAITVDNLKIAQFIYLLLNNREIRDAIDTITSKVVLILGRFTDERKAVLDALREELRKYDKLPVLFDFEKPTNRDFTETVRTLAHLAQFIIADLTDFASIPQELQAIIPDLEVPVQPILEEGEKHYSMFPDLRKHSWVFPVYHYKDQASLIAALQKEIIEPADRKARELAVEKAKRLERP